MKCPAEVYAASPRPYHGLPELDLSLPRPRHPRHRLRPHLHAPQEDQHLHRAGRPSASASRKSTTAFGSSASCTTISATSIWSRKPCNPSTTRSARGCHPCLRYDLSPMSPGRTMKNLERAKGFEPSTPTLARSCSTPELHPRPTPGRATIRPDERAPMPNGARLCNRFARRPSSRGFVPLVVYGRTGH